MARLSEKPSMVFIACLGNPGAQYKSNRHNIGFIIGDYLSTLWNIRIRKSSFSSLAGSGIIDSNECAIIMPQTFMNLSGRAIKSAADYFRVEPSHIIVVHDEIELPFGVFKTKFGGGHKGHNGIRSIIEHLGSADFYRFRFGVGRPENPNYPIADYVLSNFTKEEMQKIDELLPEIAKTIITLIASI